MALEYMGICDCPNWDNITGNYDATQIAVIPVRIQCKCYERAMHINYTLTNRRP